MPQTQYRPEQWALKEFFNVYAPRLQIKLEYPIDFGNGEGCIIDVMDLTNNIAYRLSGIGSPHDTTTGQRKYNRQREILESLGIQVIDVREDSYNWQWLWSCQV